MERKFFFKVLLITVMLFIPLIPGITLNGYAGAPEPPTEGVQLAGPQIVGILTLVHSGDPEDYSVKATFYGFCRGLKYPLKKKFCNLPIFVPFNELCAKDDITKEYKNLLGYLIYAAGPEDCHSECGGEDLVITKVNKCVNKSATKIVAEVQFLDLVPAY